MNLRLKREPKYRPRKPRVATFINSVALLPDDREIALYIQNVSPGGFMAVAEDELEEGTWFGVAIPARGIIRAQVRWFEEGMFGARFETPLELQEVEQL